MTGFRYVRGRSRISAQLALKEVDDALGQLAPAAGHHALRGTGWLGLRGQDGAATRLLPSARPAVRVGQLTPVALSLAERERYVSIFGGSTGHRDHEELALRSLTGNRKRLRPAEPHVTQSEPPPLQAGDQDQCRKRRG